MKFHFPDHFPALDSKIPKLQGRPPCDGREYLTTHALQKALISTPLYSWAPLKCRTEMQSPCTQSVTYTKHNTGANQPFTALQITGDKETKEK